MLSRTKEKLFNFKCQKTFSHSRNKIKNQKNNPHNWFTQFQTIAWNTHENEEKIHSENIKNGKKCKKKLWSTSLNRKVGSGGHGNLKELAKFPDNFKRTSPGVTQSAPSNLAIFLPHLLMRVAAHPPDEVEAGPLYEATNVHVRSVQSSCKVKTTHHFFKKSEKNFIQVSDFKGTRSFLCSIEGCTLKKNCFKNWPILAIAKNKGWFLQCKFPIQHSNASHYFIKNTVENVFWNNSTYGWVDVGGLNFQGPRQIFKQENRERPTTR